VISEFAVDLVNSRNS